MASQISYDFVTEYIAFCKKHKTTKTSFNQWLSDELTIARIENIELRNTINSLTSSSGSHVSLVQGKEVKPL